ncbi:MAG: hypothetical protein KA007_02170 [Candidatus Pacebacteria bacterium]|jgi:hypothetical protein|nr:hypothetical protein [Candidatus Paceibacterota bacterium]
MKREEFFTSHGARVWLLDFAEMLFDNLISLPKDVRPDDKERTGIKILIREIGTRNIIFESIAKPSEAAQFFAIEKAVRSETLGHATSQNSENPEKMKYAGSVTAFNYQVSVSGLKADEDVFIAIAVMAKFLDESIESVIFDIEDKGGLLPEWCSNRNLYHWKVL